MELKFKKFQPLNNEAINTINDFVKRGGSIIMDTKTFVEIQRMDSIARIDQKGRVDWRAV